MKRRMRYCGAEEIQEVTEKYVFGVNLKVQTRSVLLTEWV